MIATIGRRVFAVMVALQALTIAAILGWYLYFVNQDLEDIARQSAENTANEVTASIHDYFQPAKSSVIQLASLYEMDVLTSTDGGKLEHYFIERLQSEDAFDGLFLGWPDGEFLYVKRDSEKPGSRTRTKAIAQGDGTRSVMLTWRGEKGQKIESQADPEDQYDPRNRPWYRLAVERGSLAWTEPYIFFTSRKPGITVALPIFDDRGEVLAVAGIDLEMDRISAKLGQLSFQHGGTTLVVDEQGRILAHPNQVVIAGKSSATDQLDFQKVSEATGLEGALSPNVLRLLGQSSLQESAPRIWPVRWDGQDFQAAFTAMASLDWPWGVVAVVAQRESVEAIEGKLLLLAVIAALIFILCLLFGYLFSRALDRPLQQLQQNALLAQNGNIELMVEVDSKDQAVSDIAGALHTLAGQMRRAG